MPTSWIQSANETGCEFPLENLPLGVTRQRRICTRIGDHVVDLHACAELGIVTGACLGSNLNDVARERAKLRTRLVELFDERSGERVPDRVLLRHSDVELGLPFAIGDYTDFYASIHHATRVGRQFRPEAPLLPNYKHVPIAYHGRASSVVASGCRVVRPTGQLGEGVYGPSERLDYEAELGIFVGQGNGLGAPIPIEQAEAHIFGLCLVNDWSARDIQRWEYQPLGPFLSKSFATSISTWVIMPEALAPYRTTAPAHDVPTPAYLSEPDGHAFDIVVEVRLNGELMGRMNARELYWTPGQMIAHHTSNGCNLRTGDLIASGTLSGASESAFGCLLEARPQGPFLQDGDEVVLTGFAERDGLPRIGFGECRGTVVPAI